MVEVGDHLMEAVEVVVDTAMVGQDEELQLVDRKMMFLQSVCVVVDAVDCFDNCCCKITWLEQRMVYS